MEALLETLGRKNLGKEGFSPFDDQDIMARTIEELD